MGRRAVETPEETAIRIADYLDRLRTGRVGRKAQFLLDGVAEAWSASRIRGCLRLGVTHLDPTAEAARTIAPFASSTQPLALRQSSLAGLAYVEARLFGLAELDILRQCFADAAPAIRLGAARVASRAMLGRELGKELRVALADDLWTIRWMSVHALAPTAYDGELAGLAAVLAASKPTATSPSRATWDEAAYLLRPRCLVAGVDPALLAVL